MKAEGGAGSGGCRIGSASDFVAWVGERSAVELDEPFTFVVDADGVLLLAPRRSEHVACAGGGPVLSAGEISFTCEEGRWVVGDVSNQSTGYCPDLSSWAAVAQALDRAGLGHPAGFTHEVVFRRCPDCGERSIVREGDFVCVFCGCDLPVEWNVDPAS
nr:TFIIB-type zinc ribbon-containing protein [Streptomyces cupreus]